MATGFIQTAGPTLILSATGKSSAYSTAGTTVLVGDWYRIHPKLGRPYITCRLSGSSAVSTATATVNIEGSNDGITAASTPLYTFSGITLTTDIVVLGGSLPTTLGGTPGYVRANLTSLTTTTAGSTANLSNNVAVHWNSGYLGQ
tara:strand:+ start:311 stop:745 length:435 start_codon:yes stop_codon:yes gene_type:complete